MKKGYRDEIIKMWKNELSAEDAVFKSEDGDIHCMKIGERYVMLDSFPAMDTGQVICIETADKESAQKGIFEDSFTYWDGDDIATILEQMKKDLS